MAELHRLLIVIRGCVNTPHHTLVITEEENTQAGDTVDPRQQGLLLQLVHDIGTWNEIHGGSWRGEDPPYACCMFLLRGCFGLF